MRVWKLVCNIYCVTQFVSALVTCIRIITGGLLRMTQQQRTVASTVLCDYDNNTGQIIAGTNDSNWSDADGDGDRHVS